MVQNEGIETQVETGTDSPSPPGRVGSAPVIPAYRIDPWGWPIETITSWSKWRKAFKYLIWNVRKAIR